MATLQVYGTAYPEATLDLYRNGTLVVGNVPVNSSYYYDNITVPLVLGANVITAVSA